MSTSQARPSFTVQAKCAAMDTDYEKRGALLPKNDKTLGQKFHEPKFHEPFMADDLPPIFLARETPDFLWLHTRFAGGLIYAPWFFFPPQCSIPNWVKPLEICRKYQTST